MKDKKGQSMSDALLLVMELRRLKNMGLISFRGMVHSFLQVVNVGHLDRSSCLQLLDSIEPGNKFTGSELIPAQSLKVQL